MEYREVLLLLVAFCCWTRVESNKEEIMAETMPAYTIALKAADVLNATLCRKELEIFREAVDKRILWAVKVLDSSGEPKPGFMFGNNYWLGSKNQCYDVLNRKPLLISEQRLRNASRYRKPEDEFPPFTVNYFSAYFNNNSTQQYHLGLPYDELMTLGLCLPASCNTDDVGAILKTIFHDRTLLAGDVYSADFKLIEIRDPRNNYEWLWQGKYIFLGLYILGTIALMIMGTVYDVLVHQKRLKDKQKFIVCENNNTSEAKHDPESGEGALGAQQPEGRFAQFVMCFSIYTNTADLFKTKLPSNAIPAIHGLRFLGMIWIIMIHTVLYQMDFIDNKVWVFRLSDDLFAQILSNAVFSVDTFFFLSGFLLGYLYLNSSAFTKEVKPINYKKKVTEFGMMLLKRLVRLTPTYLVIIGLIDLNSAFYGSTSIFYMIERPQERCAKYWWRNLLYINNFFDRDEMCLSWSWYIANDTQFFVIGCILVVLSTIYYTGVIAVLGLTIVISIITSGYISYIYEYIPTLDQEYNLTNALYNPPWMRISPYLVGVGTAFLLRKLNNELHLKRRTLVLCWIVGSSCNILTLFGLWRRHIPLISATFYTALSRTAWGVGIGWLIIACCTNNAGFINTVLSFRGWTPMSRLTYGVYLLNPALIQSVFLNNESAAHIDFLPTGLMFLGMVIVAYACAYVLFLGLEVPYILLLRIFFNSRSRKK